MGHAWFESCGSKANFVKERCAPLQCTITLMIALKAQFLFIIHIKSRLVE